MLRTYKYLLRPTPEQLHSLDCLLWQSRRIYNLALEQRIQSYQDTGKGIGYCDQWKSFRELRKTDADCSLLNASSMQQVLRRLDKAFTAFFRRVKSGETPGFPRYKGHKRFRSVEYTYGDGCKLHQNGQGRRFFYLQHLGEMGMCYHRAIPREATLKHAVIKRVNRRWYVCLMLELPDPQPQHREEHKAVGVDVGLISLLALSDGTLFENPRWLRESLIKLRVLQRRLSRREKGSQGWYEACSQVAGLHEHIGNQRRDHYHKITRELVNEYSLIGIENMSLVFMNQDRHLSLSSHDAGLGEFRQLLGYKAEEAGTRVVAVDPAYTSQVCSGCGEMVLKELTCPARRFG
jgi:putative transposase